jgi:hypothetical protein
MARVTAEQLARHLETSGFLPMKRPPTLVPDVGLTVWRLTAKRGAELQVRLSARFDCQEV